MIKDLFKKIEIKKFNKLIRKGALVITTGHEVIAIMYKNKEYKPINNLMIGGAY